MQHSSQNVAWSLLLYWRIVSRNFRRGQFPVKTPAAPLSDAADDGATALYSNPLKEEAPGSPVRRSIHLAIVNVTVHGNGGVRCQGKEQRQYNSMDRGCESMHSP
jgi:hypothetical protein